ncbi:MAG: HAD-IA family hydrolase [Gammaproteobacteria bacterium]|nr:HAD-IA family hydrolase [Gammaproteobacteria bacterium]
MTRLIILDWDGTLMDSEARIVASAMAAAQDLERPDLEQHRVRDIIGLGLMEAVRTLFPEEPEAFCLSFIERYRSHFLAEDGDPMPLFPGVDTTLAALSESGYLLAVATGKGRAGLDRALRDTGLGPLFVTSRCADESCSKPHPRMVEEILEFTGVEPAAAVMVGDTEFDLNMAANAGIGAIGVTYGVQHRDRLQHLSPWALIEEFPALPGVLRDLNF